MAKPRSTFHNYVCEALLKTIEKPVKIVSIEDKLSNPASTKAKFAQKKKSERGTTPGSIEQEKAEHETTK